MKKQNKNKFFLARSVAQRRPCCPSSPRRSPTARPCRRGCGSFGKNYLCFVFLLSIFYFLFSVVVLAQFELPTIGSIKPAIILNSDPTTPLPNSGVTITANLSGIINGDSNYVWFLNGVRQTGASGLNKNVFTFRTGGIGTIYRINVSVTTPNGENLSDTINFTVSDVDLTWVANSEAPIFYRAKLMPTQNSLVIISALPFIYRSGTKNLIASNNLTYNWKIDGKMDSEKSGVNKSSYALRVNNFPGNSHDIRLEIKTTDDTISLIKDVMIPVVKPRVLLHFSDPKTNLPFGAALKNLMTKSKGFNFIAQTYFFTAPAKNLKWQWFVNNAEVGGGNEKPWLATLNLANDFLGQLSAQIKVTAQNPSNELEIAQSITNLEIR
ncbi:hypothetical protein A2819_03135 [Candidatus Azambacteria bacterium RIFCSPHIGHO2_01_FULL_40_24]|uniref:Uncharacterized protein n=1 Tax=Candidatus Azambacteria bacterium RIFCSPHIGHO2_01_FULL_40_24 TaxID=1797301 RepID=A0A1F5B2C9_9BACT|nr:MAG: hypothetical protein A2819_03135 [Candidatus Azambacteria bacterium RIFCSPHIGHO2_01_FULL_40_24]